MYAFLRLTVCVVAAVVLCSAVANADIVVQNHYRLGEADPGAAIGNVGNDPTIDSGGYLNLGRVGSPTYVAGSPSPLGSTLAMDFANSSGTTDYYTAAGTGLLRENHNWGVDFWLKVGSYTEVEHAFVHLGGTGGSWDGTDQWGLVIQSYSAVGNRVVVQDLSGWFFTGDYIFPIDEWVHVVYANKTPTGPGTDDGDAHLWVDGVEIEAYSGGPQSHCMPFMYQHTSGPGTTMPNRITVGASHSSSGYAKGCDASVDELRLFTFAEGQFQIGDTEIPEPGTLAMLAGGLLGLLCYAWRKRK